jgi:hypothetical protein
LLFLPRLTADEAMQPLCRALVECGVGAEQVPHLAQRLSRPSLMLRAPWRTARKGRPADVDFALAAYLISILCEVTGRKFPLTHGHGPMWRALIAALPLAQLFLARRFGPQFVKCSCKRDLFRDRYSGRCVDKEGKATGYGCTEAEIVRKHSSALRRIVQRVRSEVHEQDFIAANAHVFRMQRKKVTKQKS